MKNQNTIIALIGCNFSGKTAIANHLQKNYNLKMLPVEKTVNGENLNIPLADRQLSLRENIKKEIHYVTHGLSASELETFIRKNDGSKIVMFLSPVSEQIARLRKDKNVSTYFFGLLPDLKLVAKNQIQKTNADFFITGSGEHQQMLKRIKIMTDEGWAVKITYKNIEEATNQFDICMHRLGFQKKPALATAHAEAMNF